MVGDVADRPGGGADGLEGASDEPEDALDAAGGMIYAHRDTPDGPGDLKNGVHGSINGHEGRQYESGDEVVGPVRQK